MTILEKAHEIVYSQTENEKREYGSPLESFTKAADIASILCGKEITAKDIARIQISLKLSRETNAHKEDNLIDLCGYASILNDLCDQDYRIAKPEYPSQTMER